MVYPVVTLIFPLTVNLLVGVDVPRPIFPLFLITILSIGVAVPSNEVVKDILPGISDTFGVQSTPKEIPALSLNVPPSYQNQNSHPRISELVTIVLLSTVHLDFAEMKAAPAPVVVFAR